MTTAFTFLGQNLFDFNDIHAFQASPLVVFVLVAAFYVALCLLWVPRVGTLAIPLSRPVSDLTYPIYLLHAHIGYTVLQKLGAAGNIWLIYPLMLIGLMAAAWLLHWGVEVKGKSLWYRAFGLLRGPFDSVQNAMGRIPLRRTS